MKSVITFVNPNTYERRYLDVNFSITLLLSGIVCTVLAIFNMVGSIPADLWYIIPSLIVLGHIFYYRFLITGFPVIISIAGALSSGGITMIASAFMINRYIAEAYRDNGWKVSDHEGNIGEYSSRFLAQEEFNFSDSDVLNHTSTKKD